MIVECQDAFRVVETFYVLIWLCEVRGAVCVLQHVHVFGDARHPFVLMLVLVEEVDIPHVIARVCRVPKLLALLEHPHHQVVPTVVVFVLRHDHFVNVEQGDKLVLVHIFIQTIVVRDQLVLPLLTCLLRQVQMLEPRNIRHSAGQRQWRHMNFVFLLVMSQNFRNVRMNLKFVEVNFVSAQQRDQFNPLDEFHRKIIVQEVQPFHANSESFFAVVNRQIINDFQIIRRRVALLFDNRHRSWDERLERFGNLTRDKIGLEVAVNIISPLTEPHVFILECLDDERLFLTVKPKLTKSFHGRVDAVDHAEYANGRANFGILPHVIIRAK